MCGHVPTGRNHRQHWQCQGIGNVTFDPATFPSHAAGQGPVCEAAKFLPAAKQVPRPPGLLQYSAMKQSRVALAQSPWAIGACEEVSGREAPNQTRRRRESRTQCERRTQPRPCVTGDGRGGWPGGF
jgi:hypothetical protein